MIVFIKDQLTNEGGICGLGSSGWAYVGKFYPKWSKFGTIVYLGSKTYREKKIKKNNCAKYQHSKLKFSIF